MATPKKKVYKRPKAPKGSWAGPDRVGDGSSKHGGWGRNDMPLSPRGKKKAPASKKPVLKKTASAGSTRSLPKPKPKEDVWLPRTGGKTPPGSPMRKKPPAKRRYKK